MQARPGHSESDATASAGHNSGPGATRGCEPCRSACLSRRLPTRAPSVHGLRARAAHLQFPATRATRSGPAQANVSHAAPCALPSARLPRSRAELPSPAELGKICPGCQSWEPKLQRQPFARSKAQLGQPLRHTAHCCVESRRTGRAPRLGVALHRSPPWAGFAGDREHGGRCSSRRALARPRAPRAGICMASFANWSGSNPESATVTPPPEIRCVALTLSCDCAVRSPTQCHRALPVYLGLHACAAAPAQDGTEAPCHGAPYVYFF